MVVKYLAAIEKAKQEAAPELRTSIIENLEGIVSRGYHGKRKSLFGFRVGESAFYYYLKKEGIEEEETNFRKDFLWGYVPKTTRRIIKPSEIPLDKCRGLLHVAIVVEEAYSETIEWKREKV